VTRSCEAVQLLQQLWFFGLSAPLLSPLLDGLTRNAKSSQVKMTTENILKLAHLDYQVILLLTSDVSTIVIEAPTVKSSPYAEHTSSKWGLTVMSLFARAAAS
jgi:hypothetical protein